MYFVPNLQFLNICKIFLYKKNIVLKSTIYFRNEFLSSPRLDNQVHCYTGKNLFHKSENLILSIPNIFLLKNFWLSQ